MSFQLLERNRILSRGSRMSLQTLYREGNFLSFRKGDHLYHDKDMVPNIYFVIEGYFSLYKLNTLGEKKVFFVLGKDAILNESIAGGMPSSVSAEAFTDGRVFAIGREFFLKVIAGDPRLFMAVMEEMEHKVRRLYRQLKNTTGSLRMDKRLASKLWKLSMDHGKEKKGGAVIDLDLSNTYLAEMLGTKRETISRQMKILSEKGLVKLENNRIFIPSRENLRKYFQSP